MSNHTMLTTKFFEKNIFKLSFIDSEEATMGLVEEYNQLLKTYHQEGLISKVKPIYEKALNIKKSIFGEGHNETASIYSNLGHLYFSEKNLKKASLFYRKALHIRIEVLGEYHLQTANSYHDLACFYASEGEFETAKMLFKSALNIRKKLLSKNNSLALANSYLNLGMCYYHLFKYQKSYKNLVKALKIKKLVLNKKDERFLILQNNLNEVKKHISVKSRETFLGKLKKYFYNSFK